MKSKISISIIVFIVLLFTAVSYFYFFHDNNSINGQNFENNKIDTDETIDDDIIHETIKEHPSDSYQIYPKITHENVKELLSKVQTPDNFCWYFRSSLYSDIGILSENGILLADGDNYKIEIYSKDNILDRSIIKEGNYVSVSTEANKYEPQTYSSTEFSLFSEAGVPDPSTFLENISDQFTYSITDSEYGSLIYCSFQQALGSYSQKEEYYISLEYGIVIKASCYENEKLIYSLETTALYELGSVD